MDTATDGPPTLRPLLTDLQVQAFCLDAFVDAFKKVADMVHEVQDYPAAQRETWTEALAQLFTSIEDIRGKMMSLSTQALAAYDRDNAPPP